MSDIQELEQIKKQLLRRMQERPELRVRVDLQHPKLHLENAQARLTGVYAHIFQIEAGGQRYTLPYADVLLHRIEILD